MTTRGAGGVEPMERLSATERLKGYCRTPSATFRQGRPAAPARADHDGDLVAALRRRDRTVAECLVARYGGRAYRLAMGITRNAQDAEETVQDALWSVIRKIDTFRGDSSLGSWIYRIVANAAYQKLRGRAYRRDEISLDEVLPSFHEDGQHAGPITDWSASIDDPAAQTELRAVLGSAIEELPAAYRAVIVLHDVEGLSMAEVATSLRITVATAKSRTHRARLFLRKRLAIFVTGRTAPIGASSHERHMRQPDGQTWKVERPDFGRRPNLARLT